MYIAIFKTSHRPSGRILKIPLFNPQMKKTDSDGNPVQAALPGGRADKALADPGPGAGRCGEVWRS